MRRHDRSALAALALPVLVAVLLLDACSDGEGSPAAAPSSSATAAAPGPAGATAATQPVAPVARLDPLFGGEIVRIDGDGLTISGELAVPPGDGPRPAVFFISGSGSQRRDGLQPPFDFGYEEIFEPLVEADFAVLAVDDRGTGGTPIGVEDPAVLGYDTLVGDAAAAYRFLLRRPEVDPARVFVMGHSEGGVTALVLATTEQPAPAGLVLMATPGRNIVEVSVDQVLRLLPPGAGAATRADTEARQRATLRAMIEDTIDSFPAGESERALMRAQAPYLRGLAQYEPAALLASLDRPVLIIQGDADFQVRADADGSLLAESAAHPDARYVLIEDADHLLRVEEGESGLERYLRPRPLHAEFVPALRDWLAARASE